MAVVSPRATVLAVIHTSDAAWLSLAGTLAWYGWRGARTVLVAVGGTSDKAVRERLHRSLSLLQVEQHFHWELLSDESLCIERLTRTCRAFQPHALLSTPEMLSVTQRTWHKATDTSVVMPGLVAVDPALSRLWVTEGRDATINISAARGVKHALRLLWHTSAAFTFPMPRVASTESFARVEGRPLSNGTTELLDGFAQGVLQSPIYFEERNGFSVPISTH